MVKVEISPKLGILIWDTVVLFYTLLRWWSINQLQILSNFSSCIKKIVVCLFYLSINYIYQIKKTTICGNDLVRVFNIVAKKLKDSEW